MYSFTTANNRYFITSHGNGWAYEIKDKQTGASLWFQDQDACTIQEETNDFENEVVIDEYFDCMED